GLPLDAIAGVFHGSTDFLGEGFGSYSSRSVVMGGSAVIDAAARLKAAIRMAAAGRLGCAENEVAVEQGTARGPAGNIVAGSELAADNLSAHGTFASTKRPYSYRAHAAQVAGDPGTRAIERRAHMRGGGVRRI